MPVWAAVLALSLILTLSLRSAGPAQPVPSGFTETVLVGGLLSPTAMAIAPDGRIFVCEQTGSLRVVKGGKLLLAPFLRVAVDPLGERGLLGVTFDPDFAANGFVYVYYTAPTTPRRNRVSRFTASGDAALPGSETVILELDSLTSSTNHNGGALHFGTDGYLYVATGEAFVPTNAQVLTNRLGKILRIAADGSIPTTNPFYNTAVGLNQSIWALGLRNPFTFAFQRTTGRMFINDVGADSWEEINEGTAGANYGWPITEGATTDTRFVSPLLAYPHGDGTSSGCSITGGVFYDPETIQFPATLVGDYFYADFCNGWIRAFDPRTGGNLLFATGLAFPVDLDVAPDGTLYCLTRGQGILRYEYTLNRAPSILRQPADETIIVGQAATYSVGASGSAPLQYQWQRDGADIPGAIAASYTLTSAALADSGARFRVLVSNTLGSVTSAEAALTVVTESPPAGTITSPPAGARYRGGDTIAYAGSATDPEDGVLGPGAFTWKVDFHHAEHAHPFIPPTTGSPNGSFKIPTTGETAPDVWYRIYLTVRDSTGFAQTTFRDIQPVTSTFRLATSPSGMQVTLDGQPVKTPHSVTGVVGVRRTLGAVSPQNMGSTSYAFSSWSDGGAATHGVLTPATETTYTAIYKPSGEVALSSLDILATTVKSGVPVRATLRLSGLAPAPGAVVTFSSTSGAATAPKSVTVRQGASTAAVTITTRSVRSSTPVTIRATYRGLTRSDSFTIRP